MSSSQTILDSVKFWLKKGGLGSILSLPVEEKNYRNLPRYNTRSRIPHLQHGPARAASLTILVFPIASMGQE